jgi:thiol:disulfide interchange protein DsbG
MKPAFRIVLAGLTAGLLTASGAARAATAPPSLGSMAGAIQNAPAISEGAQGSAIKTELYVFMDPNCIFCHIAWKALQPYEAEGLAIHWIPLGFLKPDSPGKAAALLQAENGPALLKQLETHYSEKDESGGIAPLPTIPAAAQSKLASNAQLFQTLGFQGTPTVVYRDAHGAWQSIDGLPRLGTLPALLNLPAQPITDPELQRYK